MADSKKYNGSTWEHSLRKLTTATGTFTTLPADVYADGNNATVALKGNTVQNGTPTPSNPVDVNGVGVRTENLFDVADVILGYHINNSGEIESKSNRMCTAHNIDLTGISEITLSFQTSLTQGVSAIFALYSAGVLVSRMAIVHAGDTIDVSNGDSCLIAFYSSASIEVNTQNTTNIMLNVGSTAKPYEPYGYKIPISSGGKNLFDLSTATNEFINSNGSITPASAGDPYYLSDYISADNVTISVEYKETAAAEIFTVGVYDSSKSFIRRDVISNNSVSYENVAYIRINYRGKNCQNVMVNRGSTPLPYEPYNRTTTPVYLGEVDTTRQIRKLVLDGSEDWSKSRNDDTAFFKLQLSDYKPQTVAFCSHFEYANVTQSGTTLGFYIVLSSGMIRIRPENIATTSLESFLSFLSTQYSNGTPVTVWYVLETEETGIVNEPLMKIGDYADTVSGITIPTITGKDTFDVDTTLKPSEVSLSYTGWHDASVKEFDGSQWNE